MKLLLHLVFAGLLSTTLIHDALAARIAVIYAESDGPAAIDELLGGMENTPGVEIIRVAIKDSDAPHIGQILLAGGQRGTPLRVAAAGGAATGPIAVLYPDIGEPYRSVFTKIIEGIEESAQTKVASYAVGNSANIQSISEELRRQDIRIVIALGRNGLKAASALDREVSVVASGVISAPETEVRSGTILSLAPDPALLFARLKQLSPRVQRVTVIYEPHQNGWLIRLARDAARQNGLELVAQEAGDLKSALLLYQAFFANADPRRDALWLPQDSATVDESLVLPLVLQESWTKAIPVFSSNLSHVKRGALFALYPNNIELGRHLAVSAAGMASGTPAARGVQPLRNVLTAFNTRTASHLGLAPSPGVQQGFDLLFPEQ